MYLTYVEQVRLAKLMDEAGIEVINVGFPALSEDEKRAVRRIVNESFTHTKLVASAEPTKNSIDACLDCGIKEIVIESPINGLNLQYKLKITKEQGLQRIVDSIKKKKKHGVTVNFTLWMYPTPERYIQCFEAAAMQAPSLVIADSVGFIRPLSMRYLISHIQTVI